MYMVVQQALKMVRNLSVQSLIPMGIFRGPFSKWGNLGYGALNKPDKSTSSNDSEPFK